MLYVCQALVNRFPALWKGLKSELARLEIECEIIPGENPWLRDYMPVRIPGLGSFQFRYAPQYHQKARYRESEVVHVPKHLSRECLELDWVMDGGGVLADDSVVLLSAKFPPPAPTMLKIFEGKSVLTVPQAQRTSLDIWTDCAVFTVESFFSRFCLGGHSKLDSICERMSGLGYELVSSECRLGGARRFSAGVYLNYMLLGNCAFVPVSTEVDIGRQHRALRALQRALGLEIIEIPADECAREGGALHCVMWSDSHHTLL